MIHLLSPYIIFEKLFLVYLYMNIPIFFLPAFGRYKCILKDLFFFFRPSAGKDVPVFSLSASGRSINNHNPILTLTFTFFSLVDHYQIECNPNITFEDLMYPYFSSPTGRPPSCTTSSFLVLWFCILSSMPAGGRGEKYIMFYFFFFF